MSEEVGEHGNGRLWFSPGLVLRGARAGVGAALHPRESLDRVRAAVELIVRDEVIGAPQSSLNGPMSGTRHFATVRLDLADVKATKTRLGGTVNDVVLALCAGGLRHLLLSRGDALPEGDLRAQVPVNIRSEDQEHALGNELTSLFVELPVSEADPIARYRRVVERAEQLKAGSQRAGGKTIVDLADMGPPLAGALLARSMFGGTRMFNLTITNVPGPQQRLYAFGAPLVEVLPLVPLFAGHTIGIAVVSYAGEMVFGLNADRMAAPDVGVLAEGIKRSFCGAAPARGQAAAAPAGGRRRVLDALPVAGHPLATNSRSATLPPPMSGSPCANKRCSKSRSSSRRSDSRSAARTADGSSPIRNPGTNVSPPPRGRVRPSANASALRPPPVRMCSAVSSGQIAPSWCAVIPGASSSPNAKPSTFGPRSNSCKPVSLQRIGQPKASA